MIKIFSPANAVLIVWCPKRIQREFSMKCQELCYIILNTIQVVFYVMSDGTPQEVLSKIFRVFDVNR